MVSARPVIAVAAVLSLGFWFIEIDRAFGLPAHPLLIHVPLVFVPILGLAALALACNGDWLDRYGVLVAAFAVVTLAFTLLAAGAGEAFLENRERIEPRLADDPTMEDHEDAGTLLRFVVFGLTFGLVGMLFAQPKVLRAVVVLLALVAIFYAFRTGHLGADVVWGSRID